MDDYCCLWYDILSLESTRSRSQNAEPAAGFRWHNSIASLLVHGTDCLPHRWDNANCHRLYSAVLHHGYFIPLQPRALGHACLLCLLSVSRIHFTPHQLTSLPGTWFPLGIALFHAANLKFLRVVEMQKQFGSSALQSRTRVGKGRTPSRTSWAVCWRSINAENKVFILIGVAMVFQVALTTGMWIGE